MAKVLRLARGVDAHSRGKPNGLAAVSLGAHEHLAGRRAHAHAREHRLGFRAERLERVLEEQVLLEAVAAAARRDDLALQRAGVPYDVVPGISSAIAAPASAGIPVTHRGVASAFLVVSGHEDEAFASAIAQLQPNGVTVVVLMGLGRSAAIACL